VHRDLTAAYLRWSFTRAALWRGYWSTASLYLVVVADLSPSQLVLVGTFQGVTVLAAELPAGVLADTVGRRAALVAAHVLTGSGMVMAGVVTSFWSLVFSQCLCGFGWSLASGADVAWATDELGRHEPADHAEHVGRVDRVLAAQARLELLGAPIGIGGFAALAWATSLACGIVVSGVAVAALGAVVARWPETRASGGRAVRPRRDAAAILRRGVAVARADRVVLALVLATVLAEGGGEVYGRLLDRRLLTLGMPERPDPIVWFAALSLVAYGLGAGVLRIVERRIDGRGVARRTYVLSCSMGVAALLLFAHAPHLAGAVVATIVVSGITRPVTAATATIWVNRRAPSDVRATVHSVVSLAEHTGEVVCGLALAAVASASSGAVALTGAAALLALAAVRIAKVGDDGPGPTPSGVAGRRAPSTGAVPPHPSRGTPHGCRPTSSSRPRTAGRTRRRRRR
jgi:MFS family permease